MSGLIIWKDQAMDRLRKDFDRLLERCWSQYGLETSYESLTERPEIYVIEKEDSILVSAELPGLDLKDIELSATSETLKIRVERRARTTFNEEGFSGVREDLKSFSRTIKLPCRVLVDDISATYRDGVLEVMMPKRYEKRCRYVAVREADNG